MRSVLNDIVIHPFLNFRWIGILFIYIVISQFLSGCTGLSKISEGQYLITEYKVELKEKEKVDHPKEFQNQLKNVITKKPNGKFLWMRPRLALHNTIKEPEKEKGFQYWLKYKLGKAPVLLDETYCDQLDLTFENRLYHRGHFNASSEYSIERKAKTASVSYEIYPSEVYRIDTLILPDPIDTLTKAIYAISNYSLITKDQAYGLEKLKNERIRIDEELKNMGFYYFNPDYIGFLADTTNGNNTVSLKLNLNNEMPADAKNIYKIGEIYVAEDFRLQNYFPDTAVTDGYNVVTSANYMNPKHYLNSVLYDSSSIYSNQLHVNSIKQLMGLRAYKYVNARYTPSSVMHNTLDVSFMMTPSPKISISSELNAVTKSNSFAGPGIKLTYNSKNFFRGAELFSVNLNGRFEKQISGEGSGDTAYEIGLDANLDFPRLVPFKLRKKNHAYLPNSNIMVGAGIFSRVSLYRFNTFNTGLTYTWRKNEFLTHQLRPIDISVTNLANATLEFEKFLENNPSIRKSFEEQFIVGMSYNFTINKLTPNYPRRYYINVGIDPSGNLIATLSKLFGTTKDDADQPVQIFGQPVSQYYRIRTDLRYYFKTGKESILATRLYAGVGVPYGNSEVMPYIKQFYAGGTNSLRAFRARSLGPGSYVPSDTSNVLVDQTGDIRLETNLEYRFPIVGFLKGAVFSDIGNIWLVNEDSLRNGGKFNFNTFHKQLAAGLGFGLRIDVNLMVLRFDWAFPIRKPVGDGDFQWVIDKIDIFSRNWRKDNLLWNISIGYPF